MGVSAMPEYQRDLRRLLRSGQLSRRRPRRHLHHGVLQHQAFGDGQYYLMTIKDKDGNTLDGGRPIA